MTESCIPTEYFILFVFPGYREHKVNSQCESCLGCEPQERFVNCADIEVSENTLQSTEILYF